MSVANAKQGFRHVSVSREQGQVWAVSGAGIICRRIGVTHENPAGTGWVTGIGVSNKNKFQRAKNLFKSTENTVCNDCMKLTKDRN